jgi:hypothetical protein
MVLVIFFCRIIATGGESKYVSSERKVAVRHSEFHLHDSAFRGSSVRIRRSYLSQSIERIGPSAPRQCCSTFGFQKNASILFSICPAPVAE